MAKILLVEDDPLMVRMYQRKLVNDGYDVAIAVNGEEGMVKIRTFHPDLVLLDIMMPKLNGLQVLERTKADPTIASIPIIILTNLGGSEEDIERGLELGAVAYLVKSAYRPDEVISKVKEVLSGYTHGKEVPQAATSAAAERVLEKTTQVSAPEKKAEKPEEKKNVEKSEDPHT
jgi:DNA-binding response OmpR family regulator